MKSLLKALIGACVLSLAIGAAQASPVRYELILTIDSVVGADPAGCDSYSACPTLFGPLSVGETFRGGFTVDSSILATDGPNNTAAISDFFLPFGYLTYSTGSDNTTLAGFRNQAGPGASAPGFLIENGDVVDLIGGVYGVQDWPWIDWYDCDSAGSTCSARNRFVAQDSVSFQTASGSFIVERAVPLPDTLSLSLAALGVLGLMSRQRQRERA